MPSARTRTPSDVSGLHVNKLRRQTIYLAGLTAGLAGRCSCSPGPAASRTRWSAAAGYIAIAAVIFGGWTLKGTVAGCVLFGIVGSFVLTIPNLGYDAIDPSFLAIAPNVVTIVAMAIFATACPAAGGAGPTLHPRPEVARRPA